MMEMSRIPDFANKTFEGMVRWFSEMALRGLLYDPDEDPGHIFVIATSERLFTDQECVKLKGIVGEMFEQFGDRVEEAVYPVWMKATGFGQNLRPDADAG